MKPSTMTLDNTEQRYHVRECDNRVRVSVMRTKHNTYVSYETLVDSGRVSEGQSVREWRYAGHTIGMGSRDPMPIAERLYREAPERFPEFALRKVEPEPAPNELTAELVAIEISDAMIECNAAMGSSEPDGAGSFVLEMERDAKRTAWLVTVTRAPEHDPVEEERVIA